MMNSYAVFKWPSNRLASALTVTGVLELLVRKPRVPRHANYRELVEQLRVELLPTFVRHRHKPTYRQVLQSYDRALAGEPVNRVLDTLVRWSLYRAGLLGGQGPNPNGGPARRLWEPENEI